MNFLNIRLLYILVLCGLCFFSFQAEAFRTFEELESFLDQFKHLRSIPMPRTFHADSERTAAGILHYAIDDEKGPVVLLGLRDDDKGLCNLGGLSEVKENLMADGGRNVETLAETASREVVEESNGYYAHHPYDIERLPFVDLLDQRDKEDQMFYRMYWKKVKKVDRAHLLAAMEASEEDHSQEYEDFVWVPINMLLKSVHKNDPELDISIRRSSSSSERESDSDVDESEGCIIDFADNEASRLFEPLFLSLSTPTGKAFLESISTKGTIPFNGLRKVQNRLYIVKDDSQESESGDSSEEEPELIAFTRRWMLRDLPDISLSEEAHFKHPHSFKDPRTTVCEELSPDKTVISYLPAPIPFGQNAWGEKTQKVTIPELGISQIIPLSPEKDEKVFANAVATHGAAMVEVKRKARLIQKKAGLQPEPEDEEIDTAVGGWNPDSDLSLSRIHLKFVLGPKFKTAEDFIESSNPQRKADIANLRLYFEKHEYASDEVDTDDSHKQLDGELKRPIEFMDHDLEVFADILAWEEQNKRYPAFYHAAEASIGNLWKVYTHLRELTMCTPLLDTRCILRGTDIYFRGIRNMADILKNFGGDDYDGGRASVVLSANYVLTAGLATTQTSSSSVEYFLNNHSVEAPVATEMFEEALALAGIPGSYKYFSSLFLQYLAHRSSKAENSVILGISIPVHLLNEHSTTDEGDVDIELLMEALKAGKKWEPSSGTTPETCLGVACGVQAFYEKSKSNPASIKDPKKEVRRLIPEARLSLHPDVMLHPDTRVKAFNRFPFVSQKDEEEFIHEMRKTVIGTLADWLYSKNKVMPDSFVTYPVLKKLYSYAYQAMTGNEIEENFAIESFLHLLSNGHLEAVKEFINLFPAVVDHPDYNPTRFAYAAMRKGNVDTLKYICEKLPKEVALFQNIQDMREAVRVCVDYGFDKNMQVFECLDYLFPQLDTNFFGQPDLDELYSELLNPRGMGDGTGDLEYFYLSGVSVQLLERCIERCVANGKEGIQNIFSGIWHPLKHEQRMVFVKYGLGLPKEAFFLPSKEFREIVAVYSPERKQELAKFIPLAASHGDLEKLLILKNKGVEPIKFPTIHSFGFRVSMKMKKQVCLELLNMGGNLDLLMYLLTELDGPYFTQVMEQLKTLVQRGSLELKDIPFYVPYRKSMEAKLAFYLSYIKLGKTINQYWYTFLDTLDVNSIKKLLQNYPRDRLSEIQELYIHIDSIERIDKVVAFVEGGVPFKRIFFSDSINWEEVQLEQVSLEFLRVGVDVRDLYKSLLGFLADLKVESAYKILIQFSSDRMLELNKTLFCLNIYEDTFTQRAAALIAAGANPDFKEIEGARSLKERVSSEAWSSIEALVQKLKSTKASSE